MASVNVNKNQNKKNEHKPTNKKLMQRKSTRSMTCQNNHPLHNKSQQENFYFQSNEFKENIPIQPPSPFNSSKQQQSQQVKYLSYLAQIIDSAPENSQNNQSQIQNHFEKGQYWHMVYSSAMYVKKDQYRTQIDDNLFMECILTYFKDNKIHPEPINKIGEQLLTNGYFMIAYATVIGRKRKSPFIFKYLMQYFKNQYDIQSNQQQFYYILETYVHSDKVSQYLHIQPVVTPNGQGQYTRKQNQQNNQSQNQQNQRRLIRRRRSFLSNNNDDQQNPELYYRYRQQQSNFTPYTQRLDDQQQDYQKTIILEENSQTGI